MPKYLTMLEGDGPEMLDASPRPSQRRQLPPVARRQQMAAPNGIRSARIICGRPCPGGVSALLVGQEVDELGIDNFFRKAWNVTKDVGHVAAEVGRSTAPIVGDLVGTAAGAAFGTNTGGAAAGGGGLSSMIPAGLLDMFGLGPGGGGESAPQAAGQPQQQQQSGIDPRLLYIGGGALLLVLLVRK